MMRRSPSCVLALALGLGMLAVAGGGAGATSEALVEHGWWWRAHRRALITVEEARPPAPPQVPEDGLYVAKGPVPPDNVVPPLPNPTEEDIDDPRDPMAIAAVAYMADTGPGAILELKVASISGPSSPEDRTQEEVDWNVNACPLTAPWFGGQAEMWENRPPGLCDLVSLPAEFIPNRQNPVSMIWKLNEAYEAFPGYWSILLVPDPGEIPFQVAFHHPGQGSFVVDPSLGDDEDSLELSDAELEAYFSDGFAGFGGLTDGFGGDLGLEDGFALGEEGLSTQAQAPDGSPLRPRAARDPADDLRTRAIAMAALATLAAGLWAITRQADRQVAVAKGAEPAPVAEDTSRAPVGGIGRFARPRPSDPRRLL